MNEKIEKLLELGFEKTDSPVGDDTYYFADYTRIWIWVDVSKNIISASIFKNTTDTLIDLVRMNLEMLDLTTKVYEILEGE